MTVAERRKIIMDVLHKQGVIKITDIASMFEISPETARRDLDFLQGQQLIHRTHGGAIPIEIDKHQNRTKLPLSFGDKTIHALATVAANCVKQGETIYLGNGSTTREIARCLKHRKNLTVISNSLDVIYELVDSDVTVFVLGGIASREEHDITGDMMLACLNRFYCDKAIFSCGGIRMDLGVMDYSSTGMQIQLPVIQRSEKHILVASSHKFGLYAFLSACSLDDIDLIISDSNLSEEYQSAIRDRGIELILTNPEEISEMEQK